MLITWTFFAFVIVTYIAYWWLVPPRARGYLLALAGFLYFYHYYPKEMLFLLALAVSVYLWGRWIARLGTDPETASRETDVRRSGERRHVWSKLVLVAGVLILVADLTYFKYAAFLVATVSRLLPAVGGLAWHPTGLLVPLGISYFTFKMIHYLVDLRVGKIPHHRAIDFFNYIFFFPILVAGPIERFQPFLRQSEAVKRLDTADLYTGLPRIAWGVFKKVVLAGLLGVVAVNLQQPGQGAGLYWLASLAYTFQIYCDFSGYSDLAVGLSRIFGYQVMENFDSPYLARNLSDFWKRWHRSLTGWFRDYLFIPLGGSRGVFGRTLLNTLILMAVTGLWHGAAWHFVLWGLYHACGLIIWRLYRRYLLPLLESGLHLSQRRITGVVSLLSTFCFVSLGWVLFVCNTGQALYVLRIMFGL